MAFARHQRGPVRPRYWCSLNRPGFNPLWRGGAAQLPQVIGRVVGRPTRAPPPWGTLSITTPTFVRPTSRRNLISEEIARPAPRSAVSLSGAVHAPRCAPPRGAAGRLLAVDPSAPAPRAPLPTHGQALVPRSSRLPPQSCQCRRTRVPVRAPAWGPLLLARPPRPRSPPHQRPQLESAVQGHGRPSTRGAPPPPRKVFPRLPHPAGGEEIEACAWCTARGLRLPTLEDPSRGAPRACGARTRPRAAATGAGGPLLVARDDPASAARSRRPAEDPPRT